MTKKSVALLAMATLVLGLSACDAKEEVSEVTSVTEKVQETNTSIADKIDNINVDEKTDLSNLPDVEVPDVPEVVEEAGEKEAGEVAAMTIEEYNKEIAEFTAEYSIQSDEWDENYTSEMIEEQITCDYILDTYKENASLANVTLGEYFGEAINKIPHAHKDETFAKYREAEDSYREYYLELSIDNFMVENTDAVSQFNGAKDLTRTDFHHDLAGSMALWKN